MVKHLATLTEIGWIASKKITLTLHGACRRLNRSLDLSQSLPGTFVTNLNDEYSGDCPLDIPDYLVHLMAYTRKSL